MKYLNLLFIILISILFSCNVRKNIISNEVISDVDIKDTVLVINDIQIVKQDSIIVLNNQTINLPNETIKVIKVNPDRKPSSNAEVAIIDDTDHSNTSKGIIAYSIPTEMIVGQKYKIRVRITKDREGKDVLIIGDRNIPINDVDVNSRINIEDIRVEKVMTSELMYDVSSFLVSELSSKVQNIEDKGYTEWSWFISPLKSGKGYLKLIIKVRIDGSDVQKDIVVFDKHIDVVPDRIWSFKSWLSKYWQWLLSTIIIPFGIWLYKRKKKE
jgi:hypothetical protein